jgi:hypothetical protein
MARFLRHVSIGHATFQPVMNHYKISCDRSDESGISGGFTALLILEYRFIHSV